MDNRSGGANLIDIYNAAPGDPRLADLKSKIQRLSTPVEEDCSRDKSQLKSKGVPKGVPIHGSKGAPLAAPLAAPLETPLAAPLAAPLETPLETPLDQGLYSTALAALVVCDTQACLYFCLERLRGRLTNLVLISQATGIKYNTLKDCLKFLKNNNLVYTTGKINIGKTSGFRASLTGREIRLPKGQNHLSAKAKILDVDAMALEGQHCDHPSNHLSNHLSNHPSSLTIDEEVNFHYIFQNIATLFPSLDAHGFNAQDLRETIQAWMILGLPLEQLPVSLEKADWEVCHNNGSISYPRAWVKKSLQAGIYRTPVGFKSRREIAIGEAAAEARISAERIRQLEEQRCTDEYKIWLTNITKDEKKAFLEEINQGKLFKLEDEMSLELYFKKNIFKEIL